MAQNLMSKWAIDDAMLQAADPSKVNDEITTQEVVTVGIYRFPLSRLAWNAMRANNIKAVLYKNAGPRKVGERVFKQTECYMAVGFASDLRRFELMNTSLQIQCISAESQWWDAHKDEYDHLKPSHQHLERRGFMFGFANGVYDKLIEGKEQAKKESTVTHGSGMELVLIDRSKQVDNFYHNMFSNLRTSTDRMNRGGYQAQGAGREAGRRADTGSGGLRKQRELGN
jgi:hypothetical protein